MRMIRIKFEKYIKYSFVILLLIFIPLIVFGQVCPAGSICIENPLGNRTLVDVLRSIINWLYGIIIVGIAPIMYIIAGYRFITAAGDPEKINTAKKMVLWTSIGLMVATAVYGIIALIGEILGVSLVF